MLMLIGPLDLCNHLLQERRELAKQVGELHQICGIEVAVLPIEYVRPRAAHRMITVYVTSSLEDAYDALASQSSWLGWLSLDTEGVFVPKMEEGLRKLQTLFVSSCVSGMIHQLPLNKRLSSLI